MSHGDLLTAVHVILLKLHVITGWNMPPNEMLDILIDQLSKKLIERYPLVNADEMEFAFRNNSTVKDWGKSMNLNLIDEVMIPYLERRVMLSQIEEQRKPLELPAAQITDAEFIEAVKKHYQHHKDYKQIPVMAYDALNLNLTIDEKRNIREIVMSNAPIGANIKDLCKQMACKIYFDGNS